ncbi:hypothetical protein C3Y87_02540 [Carbonactinospora thermoautotrophica]|uniref:hypothetical protein n=1 Tax=Carbonactinospora thermoautotrophica TaxID=1469144 RepID=UPI00226F6ADC|nr:hypothetical protein [Carbonactinospora thermoautotrophica]MCX9190311.1 hypothetical protein [Carbonactinospora thermoautotrophica]
MRTQARRRDQVEAMAREAIALFPDVAPDSFEWYVQWRDRKPDASTTRKRSGGCDVAHPGDQEW